MIRNVFPVDGHEFGKKICYYLVDEVCPLVRYNFYGATEHSDDLFIYKLCGIAGINFMD